AFLATRFGIGGEPSGVDAFARRLRAAGVTLTPLFRGVTRPCRSRRSPRTGRLARLRVPGRLPAARGRRPGRNRGAPRGPHNKNDQGRIVRQRFQRRRPGHTTQRPTDRPARSDAPIRTSGPTARRTGHDLARQPAYARTPFARDFRARPTIRPRRTPPASIAL